MLHDGIIVGSSAEDVVTKEHDDMVFVAIMENPTVSPITASLSIVTEMLRRERELFIGGSDLCLTK
jgi:hypothetical protein